MLAINLVKNRRSKKADLESTSKVITAILESGLLTLKAGLYNNVVCLYPTLTIEDELLENARSILDGVFKNI
jgi:4-aminobutyrate aminotransferase/(S)-3-amino-2-methylpropionate transaminase